MYTPYALSKSKIVYPKFCFILISLMCHPVLEMNTVCFNTVYTVFFTLLYYIIKEKAANKAGEDN